MISPLYDLGALTTTITVDAPGAAPGAVVVPVVALTAALPSATILDFGSAKFAKLSAPAALSDVSLATDAIPTALLAGDAATVNLAVANPLLSDKFNGLDPDEQAAEQILAEMLLGLKAPVYLGDDAEELKYAIVLQLNYQLQRALSSELMKNDGNVVPGSSGVSRTYRDRYVDSRAAAIVERVTGVQHVRFTVAGVGV